MATAAVDAPARPRSLSTAVAVGVPAAIVVGLFLFHLWLSAPMDGPLLSDGTGYLANARWLAGIAGDFTQGRTGFYYPGYSLVISPVLRLLHDPRSAYEGVLVANALLASLSFLAYRALALRLGLRVVPATLAGLVAVLYPSVLLQSSIEWSENLYHLLFVLLLLIVDRLVERGGTWAACGTGALAAALYATHPRGLGVVPVIGVALVVLAWRNVITRRDAAIGLGALAAGFVAVRVLDATLLHALWAPDRPVTEGDILSRLFHPTLVWGTFVRSIGQIWYLLVVSAGLAAAGAVELARRRRSPFVLVVVALMASTLAASSLMMSDGTRVDHMVYGRYNEGFLPALLVFGAVGLARLRGRQLAMLAGAAIAGIVVTAGLTVLLDGGHRFSGDVAPLNVLGILAWERSRQAVDVLRISVAGSIVTLVVLGLRNASLRIALVATCVFFVATSVHVRDDVLRVWARPFEQQHVLPDAVRALPTGADVAYLESAYDPQVGNFYQEDLFDRWAGFWDGDGPAPAPLVIGTRTPPAPGARMVFPEPRVDQALWVLPGALQDRLERGGFVADAPIERVAELRVPARVVLHPGEERTVTVRVTHPSGGAPWPSLFDSDKTGDGAVRVVASWPDGSTSIGELPRTLLPGEHVDVPLILHAPDSGGDAVVHVTLVQEPGRAFDSPAEPINVTVR